MATEGFRRKVGYTMPGLLPKRLRVLRAERGLTITHAAELAGVTRETLRELELGRRTSHEPTLAKIANAYGIPVAELVELEESVAPLAEAPKPRSPAATETKEERRVIPQREEGLKRHIEFMSRLKDQRAAEVEEAEQSADQRIPPQDTWIFQMEGADKLLRERLEISGTLGFAEAVREGRMMADLKARPLCIKLLSLLAELEALTAQAKALSVSVHSDIHDKVIKESSRLESTLAAEDFELDQGD
jgi:transcriptional regulator with XRE-family HTH domain